MEVLMHTGCDDANDYFYADKIDNTTVFLHDSRSYILVPQVRNFNPLKAFGLFLAVVAFWMVIGNAAVAAEGFVLRKAAIEGGSYVGTNHDLFLGIDNEEERLQHITNMIMEIDLACSSLNEVCLYWNNNVNSKASSSQYRLISWDYRLGLSIGKYLELGWHHTSQHFLDQRSAAGRVYPLENILFLQLKFYEKPRKVGY
jgi:hypothetical protein